MTEDIFKYIDVERTIAEFGYDPRELGQWSRRKVIAICSICNETRLQSFNKSKLYIRCRPCSLKGKVLSEEHRKKISIANTGNMVGEKNHNFGKPKTKETKEKISKSRKGKCVGLDHHAFGKPMKEAAKKALKEARKKMVGEKHPRFGVKWSEEEKTRISLSKTGKPGTPMSEELKKRLSEERKGKNNPMFGKEISKTTGLWYTKIDGSKIWMRSSWEAKFAKHLDEKGQSWEYEPKVFEIILYDENEERIGTYRPDFRINGEWVEIKGRWTYDGFIKFCHFEHQYPNEKITLLRREELKTLGIKGIY